MGHAGVPPSPLQMHGELRHLPQKGAARQRARVRMGSGKSSVPDAGLGQQAVSWSFEVHASE